MGKLLDKLFERGAITEAFTKPVKELTVNIDTFHNFFFSGLWSKSLIENMEECAKEVMRLKDANDPDEWCDEWNGMPYHQFGRLAMGLRWVAREIEKIEKKAKGEKVKKNSKRAWVKVGKELGYGFP